MKKWKKICYGCLPFLVAMMLMYILTFLLLIGSGLVWGLFHFEQMKAEGYGFDGLFANEAWMGRFQILGSCFIYVVFLFLFGIWYKKKMFPLEPSKKRIMNLSMFMGVIIFGISMQCLCSYALNLILPLFPETYRSYTELMDSMGTGKGIVPFLYMGILAPMAEELIFRGLVLGYEKRELPFWCANFIQALLFGLYHQNIVQFVYAFCMGLLLGGLWQKRQSLKLVMLIHGVINISGNLIAFFKLNFFGREKKEMLMGLFVSMMAAAVSFLFLLRYKREAVSGAKKSL
ncbi:MAG: CPBP family intramembrane metalloprotease [Lachnospiraceae bacterium]|nr:CPBP family intramembrane metalloprotease [Lachnospiraceae bacterium]